MQWSELWSREHQPSDNQIKEFVDTPLWDDLDVYLKQTSNVKPQLSYSNCSMQKGMWKGWNVKYKKGGKSLCTLYPKQGYILSLVPIGPSEINEAELLMPFYTQYTQNLFKQAALGRNAISLAFVVESKEVLQDMKNLIALRVPSN